MRADQFQKMRQRAGLSKAKLARRMGVSHRTIGNWERGRTIPEAMVRLAVCVCNSSIWFLLEYRGYSDKPKPDPIEEEVRKALV